ncbi:M48 family metallopeptidase [Planomonospora algeriensis]
MTTGLPAGVPRLRAVRAVVSTAPLLLIPPGLRRLGPPVAVVAAAAAAWILHDPLIRGLGFAGVLLTAVLLSVAVEVVVLRAVRSVRDGRISRTGRGLYRLPRREHPELHALVAEVADALGARRPGRLYVWAHHDAAAVRVLPWRDELRLGLPYLTEMSRDELTAVIAYELTVLRHLRTWPMGALYRLWRREVRGGRIPPAEVRTAVETMIGEADAAGARVAGRQAMVSALYRGTLITQSFVWFAFRYAWPLVGMKAYPPDLYQGWRWKMREDDFLRRFVRWAGHDERPGNLTDRIAVLGGAVDDVPPVAGPALLSGLPPKTEAALARSYVRRRLPGGHTVRRAVAFRDVPDQVVPPARRR